MKMLFNLIECWGYVCNMNGSKNQCNSNGNTALKLLERFLVKMFSDRMSK